MNKVLTASAIVALASADDSLFSGVQKGLMITHEREIEELGCEIPELSSQAEQLAGMVAMAQKFTGHKEAKKATKTKAAVLHEEHSMEWLDNVSDHMDELGIILSVWDSDYEGTAYCKGLISSYEAKTVGTKTIMEMVMSQLLNH